MKIATIQGPLVVGADYWRNIPASRFDQAAPSMVSTGFTHNVGDWFLTKVVDRVLDVEEIVIAYPDSGPAVWDEINATCDALVLRGGNYLSPDFLSRTIGREVIERVTVPIVLFGVGVQEVPAGGVPFTPDEVAILRHIHDGCASSAVRGDTSAGVLASIGIENVVVTGCPTLYWSRRPTLQLRRPSAHRAAFTFRHGLFTRDPASYAAMFRSLEVVRDRFDDVVVVLQGEEAVLQQLHQARVWGAERTPAMEHGPGKIARLRLAPLNIDALVEQAHGLYGPYADPGTIDAVISRSFFSWDIADYLDLFAEQDVVIGCRLHSNLLSIANGTPAYFLTYDERTRELVRFLEAPSSELLDFDPSIDVVAEDWSPVERRYAVGFERFRRFLTDNGLSHRLGSGPSATAGPRGAGVGGRG